MDQWEWKNKKAKTQRSASARRTRQTSFALIVEGTSVPPYLPAQKKSFSEEGEVNEEPRRLTTASESHLPALKLASAASVNTAVEPKDTEKLLQPAVPQEKLAKPAIQFCNPAAK